MNRFQQLLLFVSVILLIVVIILYQRNIDKQKEVAILENAKEDASVCPLSYEPVCGTDNNTYANRCSAVTKSHVEVAHTGECTFTPAFSGTKESVATGASFTGIYRGIETTTGTLTVSGSTGTTTGTTTSSLDIDAMNISSGASTVTDTGIVSVPSTTSITSLSTGSLSVSGTSTASGERVTSYYNASYQYGFDIPPSMYYKGFGTQSGAVHTIGIFSSSGNTDGSFASANIRVLLYRSIPAELQSVAIHIPTLSADGTRILVKLSDIYSATVESDSANATIAQTVATSLLKKE